MKRIKVFLFNTIILVISSLVLKSIGVSFGIFISNRIGKEAVGIFQLVMSIYLFTVTIASSGINFATTKLVAEELAISNQIGAKNIAKKCIRLSFCISVFVSIALCFSSKWICSYFLHNRISEKIFYIISLALPFIAMSSAINGYFSGVRRVYKTAVSQFFEQVVKIILTCYFLNMFLGTGLEAACFCLILGDVLSEVSSFILGYLLYRFDNRWAGIRPAPTISNSNVLSRIFKVSFPLAITSYVRSALSTLKQVLIPSSLEKSGLNCTAAFAEYGIISGMAMPVILFPSILITSFSALLIPEFTRYYTKKDYKRIKEVTKLILIVTFVFAVFLVLFFLLFSDWLANTLYNDISVSTYFKILCPLIIFMYLDMVIDGILKGLNAQTSVMLINILDLSITTCFIYFFVPSLGIIGYISSIFISEIVNFVASFFKLCSTLKKASHC